MPSFIKARKISIALGLLRFGAGLSGVGDEAARGGDDASIRFPPSRTVAIDVSFVICILLTVCGK
jgi:hypothetical protein